MPWLFLLAYTSSGFAGLVYEVSWTRLLTLYIGHTTAAASAVVAAFLGGLAAGAAVGGAIAARLSPRRSLQTYAFIEIGVAVAAFLLPFELVAFQGLLHWAYQGSGEGVLFPALRLLSCLVMVFVPAAGLGATFPMAVRWYASASDTPARSTGALYFLNTTGAAVGAVLAGFVLIPRIGLSGTIVVAMAASVVAAMAAFALVRSNVEPPRVRDVERPAARRSPQKRTVQRSAAEPWLAATVLGFSGFAALVHEITWTRILALMLGPTIYAFAATLAAVIIGVAIGSGLGTALLGRITRPGASLALVLSAAAVTTSWTCSLAGRAIPRLVAQQMAGSAEIFDPLLQQGMLLTSTLILPTAILLGAAFPLALSLASAAETEDVAERFGTIYAVNTIGAVSGSLASGFVLIPMLGLQNSLRVVSALLIIAALGVVFRAAVSRASRAAGLVASAAAALILLASPPWDRELLASGAYLYAPYVPRDLDLEALLKAGSLLYYREGASATVSVKRLTGTTTLAVDGKTDASNRGDMLTQKLVAHLPLLLHDGPRDVAIIGLGSGVTAGAALSHPIERTDVIEISREVVEASRFFIRENHQALDDPRTHLIVGDGRSHLLLTDRNYDVIISEPSNPWIAGVASLFTREFFAAARARLKPGGIICQWANAYNISDRDLRSIVATFTAVFPDGIAWLVGADDVLLVGSNQNVEARLANIERHWARPGVAEDLKEVAVEEPFSLLSLFIAGSAQLAQYSAGAAALTDDTMTLEFSGPRDLRGRQAGENGAALAALLGPNGGPEIVRTARTSATAAQWRRRAAMLAKRDAHTHAYEDYVRALSLDPNDTAALDGLVRTAILIDRAPDALAWIKPLLSSDRISVDKHIAISRLQAATGAADEALETARRAVSITPVRADALEQVASVLADRGDITELEKVVDSLRSMAPDRPGTAYYGAVAALLRGDLRRSVAIAEGLVAAHPDYGPVHDLVGAAYTKLGEPDKAASAFEASLRFDAHDSTAYTNLGLLHLEAGNRDQAARYFAEALWLTPESRIAREGLARAKALAP